MTNYEVQGYELKKSHHGNLLITKEGDSKSINLAASQVIITESENIQLDLRGHGMKAEIVQENSDPRSESSRTNLDVWHEDESKADPYQRMSVEIPDRVRNKIIRMAANGEIRTKE